MPQLGNIQLGGGAGYVSGLGVEDTGTPFVVGELPIAQVILGCDNGFILQRRGPSDFVIGYSDEYDASLSSTPWAFPGPHSYRALQFEQMNVDFTNRNVMFGQAEDEYNTGISAFNGVILTTDRGRNWAPVDPGGSTRPPLQTVMNNKRLFGLDGELILVDETGLMYSQHPLISGGSLWDISIDRGKTWSQIWPLVTPSNRRFTKWIKSPYMWEFQVSYVGSPTNPTLIRRTIANGSSVSYTLTGIATANVANLAGCLNGTFVGNTLAYWINGLIGSGNVIIDITNPSSPTWTYYATAFGSDVPVIMSPTEDDNVLVALTLEVSPFAKKGKIWRTTDKGVTWSVVVASTTDLGIGLIPAGESGAGNIDNNVIEDAHRIAVSGNHIWIATKPDVIYHSANKGASWTTETVTIDYSSYAGIPPTHVLSIDAFGFDLLPRPAEARMDAGADFVWFKTDFS